VHEKTINAIQRYDVINKHKTCPSVVWDKENTSLIFTFDDKKIVIDELVTAILLFYFKLFNIINFNI
jgi:hypothetical protein